MGGTGAYSRCHMVRGGMNLTSMSLDCGRMLEDVERSVADTNYTQKRIYTISLTYIHTRRLLLDPKTIIFLSSSMEPLAQLKITVTLHIEYFKSFRLFFIMLIGDM